MSSNMFIVFDGPALGGGSTLKGHENQIEISSWNHGFTQPTSPIRSAQGSATIEKCHCDNFTFSKALDSATDDLLKMCWSGKHIDKATVTMYRAAGDVGANQSGVPFLKIEFESVIVTQYSLSASEGTIPHETVSLNYSKVTYTYTNTDKKKGTAGAAQPVSYDLGTNVVA